ncbi:hypothetical protein CASFOL_012856 [Castilleja foliolosa]|uniref:Uncharacterized protein n=1 Tax=Castilleja foliolosa TaxID=1961234 RepID=A0ABD3DMC2_9LAMI
MWKEEEGKEVIEKKQDHRMDPGDFKVDGFFKVDVGNIVDIAKAVEEIRSSYKSNCDGLPVTSSLEKSSFMVDFNVNDSYNFLLKLAGLTFTKCGISQSVVYEFHKTVKNSTPLQFSKSYRDMPMAHLNPDPAPATSKEKGPFDDKKSWSLTLLTVVSVLIESIRFKEVLNHVRESFDRPCNFGEYYVASINTWAASSQFYFFATKYENALFSDFTKHHILDIRHRLGMLTRSAFDKSCTEMPVGKKQLLDFVYRKCRYFLHFRYTKSNSCFFPTGISVHDLSNADLVSIPSR